MVRFMHPAGEEKGSERTYKPGFVRPNKVERRRSFL